MLKVITYVFVGVVGLGAGLLWSQYSGGPDQAELTPLGAYVFQRPKELTDVTLINQTEESVNFSDFLGQWTIVNFGYLSCPDICPTNLAVLSQVQKEWDKNYPYLPMQVLHVTIDPERDTPELLDEFLKYFNPKFVGLTGTLENIQNLAKQLNTLFIIEEPDDTGNYIVSHSDNIALINPEGEFVAMLKGPHKQGKMFEAFEKMLPKLTSFSAWTSFLPCH